MQLLALGTSGSLEGPDNPASGYLVTSSDGVNLLLDIGPGVLSALQGFVNPSLCHIALSHMHADHCLDFLSLLVWRRYNPLFKARSKNIFLGPSIAPEYLGRAGADCLDEVDDFSDTFDIFSSSDLFEDGEALRIGDLEITTQKVLHPTESYAMRIVDTTTSEVLVYSGDSGYCERLVGIARDADLFLCEATWGEFEKLEIPDMHLSGGEAGRISQSAGAKKLLLTHIPPWGDSIGATRAARAQFTGPVSVAQPSQYYSVGRDTITKPTDK